MFGPLSLRKSSMWPPTKNFRNLCLTALEITIIILKAWFAMARSRLRQLPTHEQQSLVFRSLL